MKKGNHHKENWFLTSRFKWLVWIGSIQKLNKKTTIKVHWNEGRGAAEPGHKFNSFVFYIGLLYVINN